MGPSCSVLFLLFPGSVHTAPMSEPVPKTALLSSTADNLKSFLSPSQRQRRQYLRKLFCILIFRKELFSYVSVTRSRRIYLILKSGCNAWDDANQGFSHHRGTGSCLPSSPVDSEPYLFCCRFKYYLFFGPTGYKLMFFKTSPGFIFFTARE